MNRHVKKMKQRNNDMRDPNLLSSDEEDFDTMARLALRQHTLEWVKGDDEPQEKEAQPARTFVHDRIISLVHEVAKEVMRPTDSLFFAEHSKSRSFARCTPLGQRLLDLASADFFQICTDYPLHKFSSVFRVFARLRRCVPFHASSYFDRSCPAEVANQIVVTALRFVKALRRVLGRESVKTANENFRRGAMDNFNGLIDAFDRLSQRRKQVTVLRFDLHYREVGSQPAKFGDKANLDGLDKFMQYREQFQRSLDRRFGKKLLGYAWVLEYGRETKWHLHYVVVLDPRPRGHEDHSGLVDLLGEKWASLTEGCGYIYNCNAHPERYKYPVLGLVSLDDPDTITGLHFLVSYMTLAGLFVKLDIQKKYNTFSKGRFPKEDLRKAGRPKDRAPGSRLRITVAQARASFMNFI